MEFCPSCSEVLEITTLNIQGQPVEFWSCPTGDWLDPVIVPTSVVSEDQSDVKSEEL